MLRMLPGAVQGPGPYLRHLGPWGIRLLQVCVELVLRRGQQPPDHRAFKGALGLLWRSRLLARAKAQLVGGPHPGPHRRPQVQERLECDYHSGHGRLKEAALWHCLPTWQNRSPKLRTSHGPGGQGLGFPVPTGQW